MDIYKRLDELGITLPTLPPAMGIYKPVLELDGLLYVSGQGSTENGVPKMVGHVGAERSIEEGQEAARMCALNALSNLEHYLKDLNRIDRVVKMLGFISSSAGFNQQPKVLNGASALLADVFGQDRGIGVRSAIGVNELPGGITCEVEFLFKLKP